MITKQYRTCVVCGRGRNTASDTERYTCSSKCYYDVNGRKNHKKGQAKECEVCGVTFIPKTTRWVRTCGRLCGAKLRVKEGVCPAYTLENKLKRMIANKQRSVKKTIDQRTRQCIQCGESMVGVSRRYKRCQRCASLLSVTSLKKYLQVAQQYLMRDGKPCKKCGRSTELRKHYCKQCRIAAYREQKANSSTHRKRCRQYGCEYDPTLRIKHVVQRDGERCYYCHVATVSSIEFRWDQRTIDHVIPISKGGGHVLDNVVVCCQRCNVTKSNKAMRLC